MKPLKQFLNESNVPDRNAAQTIVRKGHKYDQDFALAVIRLTYDSFNSPRNVGQTSTVMPNTILGRNMVEALQEQGIIVPKFAYSFKAGDGCTWIELIEAAFLVKCEIYDEWSFGYRNKTILSVGETTQNEFWQALTSLFRGQI